MITIAIIACATLLLVIVAGCSPNTVEVSVKPAQEGQPSGDGLSPLERGKLRRQILNDMEENLAIWRRGDGKELEKVFTKDILKTYKEQLAKMRGKGLDKVRLHESAQLEVTQLEKNVGQVKYTFVDKSYFVYQSTDRVAKSAQNAEGEMEIKVVKEDGRWKIGAMIGANDATL